MDSELIGFAVFIGSVIIAALVERRKANRGHKNTAKPQRHRVELPPFTPAPPPAPAAAQPFRAPSPFLSGESLPADEGLRVTPPEPPMKPMEAITDKRRRLPLPDGGLRSAVIWGEILRRKF
ncbi:MAG: hypothetical protein K2L16_08635 [Muribaculaceae bacterium]|nr:hypothetical protein [Muribaculaceae bacterium]